MLTTVFFSPSFEGIFFQRGRDHQVVKVAFVVWKSGLHSLKLTASESLPLKIGLFWTPEKWKGFIWGNQTDFQGVDSHEGWLHKSYGKKPYEVILLKNGIWVVATSNMFLFSPSYYFWEMIHFDAYFSNRTGGPRACAKSSPQPAHKMHTDAAFSYSTHLEPSEKHNETKNAIALL